MKQALAFLSMFLLAQIVALPGHAASDSTGRARTDSGHGFSLDKIGRGVKSAAKHIEEEIPKIGPAIGKAFKQATGSGKQAGKSKEAPERSAQPKP